MFFYHCAHIWQELSYLEQWELTFTKELPISGEVHCSHAKLCTRASHIYLQFLLNLAFKMTQPLSVLYKGKTQALMLRSEQICGDLQDFMIDFVCISLAVLYFSFHRLFTDEWPRSSALRVVKSIPVTWWANRVRFRITKQGHTVLYFILRIWLTFPPVRS